MAARAVAMTDNAEREIARTRDELSLTLAALERKLAARYLIDAIHDAEGQGAEALVIRRTLDADEFRWLVTR